MFARKKLPLIRSLIAEGTRIEGEIRFAAGLRVDGQVVGNVRHDASVPSLLVLSESAVVRGEIEADHVIVNGHVSGPIFARQLLELQPKAKVDGDVRYAALEMHQGATITGQLCPWSAEDDKPTLKLAASNS
jgi:cytoskeletal protein CcmA (bactofilin family)